MVGGLLIALAALGVFTTSQREGAAPTTSYVVAARDLEPGVEIRREDLDEIAVDLPTEQAARLFARSDDLIGSYVVSPVTAGDFFSSSVVRASTSATGPSLSSARRLSLTLDAAHSVNGTLAPGDVVDLLATSGTGLTARTDVLLRNTGVLAVDHGSDRFGGESAIIITLAIEDGTDVLAAVHANETATITLVESNRADDPLPQTFVTPTDEEQPGDDERAFGPDGATP